MSANVQLQFLNYMLLSSANDSLSQPGLREHQCGNTIELTLTTFLDKSAYEHDSFGIYGHLQSFTLR